MATMFFDTSALVRRYYRPESGANRVREVCAPTRGNTLLLARMAAVELAAALHRRVRDGSLSADGLSRRWRAFRLDWRDRYEVVQATERVHATAERLIFRHPLRSLDALQPASALAVAPMAPRTGPGALQFWTADRQQAAAAEREGLAVELVA